MGWFAKFRHSARVPPALDRFRLAKLGHDLRSSYEDVIQADPPDNHKRLVLQLAAAQGVETLPDPEIPPPSVIREPSPTTERWWARIAALTRTHLGAYGSRGR